MSSAQPWQTVTFEDLRVSYLHDLDGGGRTYGQEYVTYLRRHVGHVGAVFEWCSGPGFIGFALLAAGLCDRLCLADINPLALEACRRTIADNGLEDRVTVHLSNNLDGIPEAEQWDLVVGNPPHFASMLDVRLAPLRLLRLHGARHVAQKGLEKLRVRLGRAPGRRALVGLPLLVLDDGWRLHRRFYASVRRHLSPGGRVVLQENRAASHAETFLPMIREGGLQLTRVEPASVHPSYYFLWSQRP